GPVRLGSPDLLSEESSMAGTANKKGLENSPADVLECTRLETAEEIRQAILARRVPRGRSPSGQKTTSAPPAPAAEVQPERPGQRPPMALLVILDDGRQDGERVRLRGDRTVIGRSEGDVRIPHDLAISGRHAELVRQKTGHGHRWFLADL